MQADNSSEVQCIKACKRGFGSASQSGPRLHIRQEGYCLGKTGCIADFGNCKEVLQEFKEANGNSNTQPTFTECVLCGQLPIRPFQVIVSRNPQNPRGLAIVINSQRLNNPPKVTEWVGGLRLKLRLAWT